jgi:hypothetical protein
VTETVIYPQFDLLQNIGMSADGHVLSTYKGIPSSEAAADFATGFGASSSPL